MTSVKKHLQLLIKTNDNHKIFKVISYTSGISAESGNCNVVNLFYLPNWTVCTQKQQVISKTPPQEMALQVVGKKRKRILLFSSFMDIFFLKPSWQVVGGSGIYSSQLLQDGTSTNPVARSFTVSPNTV